MLLSFARFRAIPDNATPGFYPGVLVIEVGQTKGHYAVQYGKRVVNYDPSNPEHAELQKYPIYISEETLDDVTRCGNSSSPSKCKLDHGSTVKDIVGDYATFRRDGDKVRADLTLLNSTPHKAYVEEIISRMSDKIGNSIDFDYFYEISGDKAIARCVKLNSVDIVDAPAATNSLFEKLTTPTYMALSPEDLQSIRDTVKNEVSSQLSSLETKLNARFEEVETKMECGEDKAKMEDEEKKDEEKENEKLSKLIKTATLAAVQSVLPKATLESLQSLGQQSKNVDPYEEKAQLARAAGIAEAHIPRHIAQKFPAVYNSRFGAQSASTKL